MTIVVLPAEMPDYADRRLLKRTGAGQPNSMVRRLGETGFAAYRTLIRPGKTDMGFYVARLKRPYDYRVLIEAYIYTQRKNFLHSDFEVYYASLLEALQEQFGLRLSHEGLTTVPQKVFWMLFQNTVRSFLQITNPWADFLDESLLVKKLQESGELGQLVNRASGVIGEANKASEAAHREMLCALFQAIFGEHQRVVTSRELLAAGFDDSKEPDIVNYYHLL